MNEYRNAVREVERETWWSLPRILLLILVLSVASYGLGFLTTGGDLAIYRFWAPKRANAEREVFEQTQGYVQGKIEYLTRLRFQYQHAEGAQRDALAQLILSEAASVDNKKLPVDLQIFINQLKEKP